MKNLIADRIRGIEPFQGRAMYEKAKALELNGEKLIHFELGEPDFETPEHIREAAKRALNEGYTHYTTNAGLLELREAITEKLEEANKVIVDPASQICVTVGAQDAAHLAIMCTIEKGDEVLIPEPGYYVYSNCVKLASGTPVPVLLNKREEFRLDPNDLENRITSKTKMIVINSPCNPTGFVMTRKDLETVDEIAAKHDLLVLSDEIYEKITYDGQKHHSLAALSCDPDRIITVNGFSKTYAMTGWRIGYVAASKPIISEIVKLQQNTVASATAFVQKAAVEALKGSQQCVERMVREFERRRGIIVDGLKKIKGFSVNMPKGAFYAFVDIKKLEKSSAEVADYLLKKAKVVTTPGPAFGQNGEGYIRISYATSVENINQALANIQEALNQFSINH